MQDGISALQSGNNEAADSINWLAILRIRNRLMA